MRQRWRCSGVDPRASVLRLVGTIRIFRPGNCIAHPPGPRLPIGFQRTRANLRSAATARSRAMSSSPSRPDASSERSQQTYHSQSVGSSPPSAPETPRRPVFHLAEAMSSTATVDSNASSASGSSRAWASDTSSQHGDVAMFPPSARSSPFHSAASSPSMPSMTSFSSQASSLWTLRPPSPGSPLAAQMTPSRAPSPAGSERGRFSPPDTPSRHTGRGFSR